jgi:Chaperone of endosialidase
MKTKIGNSICGLLTITLTLMCLGLAPIVQAVGPDTDGSIPGSNNGEGIGVLVSRTAGVWNTGTGFEALNHVTAGNQNTATGLRSLFSDTSGGYNTASGVYSLFGNTTGFFNSATGAYSLTRNTIGNANTANGYSALYSNTEGINNTAIGNAALYRNTTANGNTALGFQAGLNQTTGGNNIYIGDLGFDGEFNVIAIGGIPAGDAYQVTYIGGIFGATTVDTGIPVLIDDRGQLGTVSSSRRFKKDIKSMDKASEAILALNPVTFHYKTGAGDAPQFGLIAEEVAAVNPDLVVRDKNGEIYTVRYDAVNAMLLNEFLKEHKKVDAQNRRIQEQETTITQLKKEMETVVARLKEQDSKIQAVSDQVEVSKPAPQMVNNDQQ